MTIAEDEARDSIPVADLPWKEEQESAAHWLHKGDYVHARLEKQPAPGGEEQVLHLSFTISGVNGSRVYGSIHHPEGLSQHDGWRFELLRRAEALPATLSEIDADLITGTTVRLMGKGSTWVDSSSGTAIDTQQIVQFRVV